jgi:hypothetical protein
MIGKNWMKAFAFAGATAAVAVAMPAISEAKSHYTGKTPAVVSMMASTSVTAPVKKTAVKHTTKKLHHKKVVKATVTSKHKVHKTVVKK